MKKVPKLSKTFGSRRMKVTLTVIAGPHQGREFSFQEHDNFIVGRAKRLSFGCRRMIRISHAIIS
jgi:hypothetical protein